MKFNIEKQKIIDDACTAQIHRDPQILIDYCEYCADICHKIDIQRIKLSSYTLGLDLAPQQCFHIWRKLSASRGYGGVMSVPADENIRTPLLDHAIQLYLNS